MKTNKQCIKSLSMVGLAFLGLIACRPDDGNVTPAPAPDAKGFYVVNEGNFGTPNADISFVDTEAKTVTGQLFLAVNGKNIGNQAQQMSFYANKGYVVVQAGGYLQVVEAENFKETAKITGPTGFSPRYFKAVNPQKGYVTDWGNNAVYVVNLPNNTLGKTIPVGGTPEELLLAGNFVYVSLSGGFGADNRVAIIDVAKDTVTSVLTVGDKPTQLVMDNNNKIWILCKGKSVYNADFTLNTAASTKGSLVRFNPLNNTQELTLTFDSPNFSPNSLNINGDKNKIYFSYAGSVYAMGVNETTLPAQPVVKRNFYGLSIDPAQEYILGCDAGNYVDAGKVIRYTNAGAVIDSFTVHITPNSCVFK